jgi:hypothetical protein
MKVDLKKIKKAYGTDQKLAVEGKWFSLSMLDGVEVKVAKSGNPNYEKMAQRLYKPYQDQIRRKITLSDSVTKRITTELLVNTLLMDWKGMPGEEGMEVPFSKETAREILDDPELKEIREEILNFSDNFAAFQLEADEELEKNSETSLTQ